MRKNECKLAIGILTSVMGNKVYDVACNILLSNFGGRSSFYTAIYQSSEVFIGVLVNIFGGVFSDRAKDKRMILVTTDLLCGIACLILAFFVDSVYVVTAVILVNIVMALFSSFNSPAASSIIKFAIEEIRISKFNSVMKGAKEVVRVVSPILSLLLLEVVGFRFVVIFNAVTFLVSAWLESRLLVSPMENIKNTSNIWRDMKEGLQLILQSRTLVFFICLATLVNFFFAGFNLFLPYTKNFFPNDVINAYATFRSAEAVGGMVAAVFAYIINKQKVKQMVIYIGLCGVFILLFYGSLFLRVQAISFFAVVGYSFFLSWFNIIFMTSVQVTVPFEYIGRVFAVIFTLAILCMPVGSFLFNSLFTTDNPTPYLVVGLGIALVSVAAFLFQRKIMVKERG